MLYELTYAHRVVFQGNVGNFPARWGKRAAVLHYVLARAVRKKRIFFLSLMCINLLLQGWDSCSGNVWMLQITQESVYCAGIKFLQCWILFGIYFFLQRNSHVKLICMSHGSCSMGRRLIAPSVCTSPVPACTQGISDLPVIPEAHSHSKVWFVFDVQNGSSL